MARAAAMSSASVALRTIRAQVGNESDGASAQASEGVGPWTPSPIKAASTNVSSSSPDAVGSPGFLDGLALRAQERRREQDLMDNERNLWHERIAALEKECAALDGASASALEAHNACCAATENRIAARNEKIEAAVEMASATVEQAYMEARTMKQEEAAMESLAQERVQSSVHHASSAQALQERAAVLEGTIAQEADVGEHLSHEISVLESRVLVEERRGAQEQRVRALHLQVTEAATRDVEESAADLSRAAATEEAEDAAQHLSEVRRLRAEHRRRLLALEAEVEEAAAEVQRNTSIPAPGGSALETGGMAEQSAADAKAAGLLAELRSRRAADARRLAAAREEANAEVAALKAEAGQLAESHEAKDEELAVAQRQLANVNEAVVSIRHAAAAAAGQCARVGQQLHEQDLESAARLASAEQRAARERRWRSRLRAEASNLETHSASLRRERCRAEQASASELEELRRELAVVRSARLDCAAIEASKAIRVTENELATASEMCTAEAAEAARRRGEALLVARERKDRAVGGLQELRSALRRQHEAAEAEHEAALNAEARAERALAQAQFAGNLRASVG